MTAPWYRPYVDVIEREAQAERARQRAAWWAEARVALVLFAAGIACGLVLAVCWLPTFAVPR